ncbi:hypothetical protein [Thermococcus sp. AM4]|uniref:hypothetical protein n=1 Tax=Thermococcus sp. (strain AM4) TaxID=246969 RepID=UPI0002299429|nr:hypothetical protein [Thermococcus sp. AM4]EEB74122.2 Hypothetical protein TAM4_1489 [Thermococcus sp. AM4]
MSEGAEKIFGAFMVFLVIAIAGWMMLDIDIVRPLGVGWFILGVLVAIGILVGIIVKLLGE